MFGTYLVQIGPETTVEEDMPEDKPETFGGGILNTILMFIGEVGIPPLTQEFYVIQAVFFLGFIFFFVIVLMNLLNALAVADAKDMLEDADMEMLHSLLTTVAFWENIVHGDPEHRFSWSLVPLQQLAKSSMWPSPRRISVLPSTAKVCSALQPALHCVQVHFLPHKHYLWSEEFPKDFFWNLQELLGWNGKRIRVQVLNCASLH